MEQESNQTESFRGRSSDRVRLNRAATLILSDSQQDAPLEVQLVDLSCEGAGLISATWVSVDRLVVLVLGQALQPQHAIRGTVIDCLPVGEQFRISIRFDPRDERAIRRIEDAFFRTDHLDY
jgi:hypothetical protein